MKATGHRLMASLMAGGVLCASSASAQPPAPPPPLPMQEATAAPAARVFASNTGVVLNFIKPDKTTDFEAVVAKVKDALQNSSNDQRRQQAASWKVYKSPDPGPAGSVLYVYIVEPVIKGADYSVTTILAEAFPAEELVALYKRYTEAFASGQNLVNLDLVCDLGK